jgi:ABC-type tungstate transport system permease subunit
LLLLAFVFPNQCPSSPCYSFDAGQKVQGQKKGGVASVQEGMQKIQNPKVRPVQRTDQGTTGLDQRQSFWNKQQEEEERVKAQRERAGQRPV